MTIQGFYNEIYFINALNKKHIYELDENLKKCCKKYIKKN